MVAITPASTNRRAMSREEFDRIPEGPPYYDYVDGEAVEVNRPSMRHQDIELCLAYTLRQHVRHPKHGLVATQIDVELPGGRVVGPDISYLAAEHKDRYDDTSGDLFGAPDLIVEIHSPSTIAYDRFEKFRIYQEAGVAWLWYVAQDSLAIEEFRWTPEGYVAIGGAPAGQVFRPVLFSGLEINLQELVGTT